MSSGKWTVSSGQWAVGRWKWTVETTTITTIPEQTLRFFPIPLEKIPSGLYIVSLISYHSTQTGTLLIAD